MAITTYSTLKTAVQTFYRDRSDVATYVDDLIDLAEGRLNFGGEDGAPPLRHHEMITSTDITPSSNVYALPSDYLQYVRVTEKASIRRKLEYITPGAVDDMYASRLSGLSNNFTIYGLNLYTYPLSSNDVELVYYQEIPALSDSNTTNWLINRYPNLYLRTCQMMAAELFKDYDDMARLAEIVNNLVDNLNNVSYLGEFTGASMQPMGPTP